MKKILLFLISIFYLSIIKAQDIIGNWKIDSFIVSDPSKGTAEKLALTMIMNNSSSKYSIRITGTTLVMLTDGEIDESCKILKKKGRSRYLLKSTKTNKTSMLVVKSISKNRFYFTVDDKIVYIVSKI